MALLTLEIEKLIEEILKNGNAVIIDTSKGGISVSELSRKKRAEIKIMTCPSGDR